MPPHFQAPKIFKSLILLIFESPHKTKGLVISVLWDPIAPDFAPFVWLPSLG